MRLLTADCVEDASVAARAQAWPHDEALKCRDRPWALFVSFGLERVTNVAMGTEIDKVVEFEDVIDLPSDREAVAESA